MFCRRVQFPYELNILPAERPVLAAPDGFTGSETISAAEISGGVLCLNYRSETPASRLGSGARMEHVNILLGLYNLACSREKTMNVFN
jgi:hypothetical protein